jgi:hypothetical protein
VTVSSAACLEAVAGLAVAVGVGDDANDVPTATF